MSFDAGALPPLGPALRAHGLTARKRLGQHFLLDLNINRKIARAAGALDGRDVVEIGPGPGGLTRALLETGARRVLAIERDARFQPLLTELAEAAAGRLEITIGDGLTADMARLARPGAAIVANLPYQIATPLLAGWLALPAHLSVMVLTFQKEVAARITATPGARHYGRLAVLANWRWRAETCFELPARAFTPPPQVTSTVVRLTPRPEPLAEAAPEALRAVAQAAFGQRRKMLRQSLKSLGPAGAGLAERAGIDPTRRAETLEIAEFCLLARLYAAHRS